MEGTGLAHLGAQDANLPNNVEDLSKRSSLHQNCTSAVEGPQFQLPMQNMVPDTALSIQLAMNGDIDGLKFLFSQGFASPRDVSCSRGYNLVRVSVTIPFPYRS